MNSLTVSELKRRGMAAIEDGLRRGPVHIVKRNKLTAVVLSEVEYQALTRSRQAPGMTTAEWLLGQVSSGRQSKAQIDKALKAERNW